MNFRYSILTITHTHKRTHTLTHAHTRAHTTRTCHHRKKSTEKPINNLANKILSLLFWACPSVHLSVRCRGHSNLVIFNRIFPNFISSSNSRSSLNTVFFCQTISKKAVKMAATTCLSNLVIIIGFLPILYMDCFLQTLVQYVLKNVILWKQRMHPRTETRVFKFSGPD